MVAFGILSYMSVYRVGIIGLGRMGSTIDDEGHQYVPYSIAASCAASEHLEVAAGADLLVERREAFGSRWGVSALYEDYREMVAAEKPDLVAICTTASGLQKPANRAPDSSFRGDSHADLAVDLAELGVPMLYVEKAMASSMERADAILEAVQRHGTKLNCGLLRRFDNRYAAVRDAIAGGAIGDPQAIVHYARTNLMHGHVHSIDTLSYLLGDPGIEAVRGELLPRSTTIVDNHLAADPHATFNLRFRGGVEAWSVPAAKWEFEVFGSDGSIRSLNNGESAILRQADGADPSWRSAAMPTVTPISPVMSCLEDLLRAHERDEQTCGHVAVAHHITEACLAVAESHRRDGAWVELPLERRDLYVFHV
jgi:predicted dehydrogenase